MCFHRILIFTRAVRPKFGLPAHMKTKNAVGEDRILAFLRAWRPKMWWVKTKNSVSLRAWRPNDISEMFSPNLSTLITHACKKLLSWFSSLTLSFESARCRNAKIFRKISWNELISYFIYLFLTRLNSNLLIVLFLTVTNACQNYFNFFN